MIDKIPTECQTSAVPDEGLWGEVCTGVALVVEGVPGVVVPGVVGLLGVELGDAEGDVTEGDVTEGDVTEGDVTEGDVPEGVPEGCGDGDVESPTHSVLLEAIHVVVVFEMEQ